VVSMRMPKLNPGRCPACGHQNQPRFGWIDCANCGASFPASSMGRAAMAWRRRDWTMIIVGGVLFGVFLAGLAALMDPKAG